MANISVIGATGIVGQELLQLLEKAKFHISKLSIYGSNKSCNKLLKFKSDKISVKTLSDADFSGDDFVFFCTPSTVSKQYVPLALKSSAKVIDLSSAYRENKKACLCIPEIHKSIMNKYQLFASPNCVASILSLVLFPIDQLFGLKKIIASTYQAVSGGGYNLLNTLISDTKLALAGEKSNSTAFNVYLHDSSTQTDGYNAEEVKIRSELKRILNLQNLLVSVTAVRVPSLRCHSVSCHLTFEKNVNIKMAIDALHKMKGIKVVNDAPFAMCNLAINQHAVFCSRVRKVPFDDRSLELWVVGDQLLKGAALNAYQIAKSLSC